MNVRAKFAELTAGMRTQINLDELVARYGSMKNLYDTEFPGSDIGEFFYEWDAVKLSIKRDV